MPKLSDIAAHALKPADEENAFRFANGARARDLREFRAVVAESDPGLVEHHRDHFHYWLTDVARDLTLAKRIRSLGERHDVGGDALKETLVQVVDARIRAYEESNRTPPARKAPPAKARARKAKPQARAKKSTARKPAGRKARKTTKRPGGTKRRK